MEDEVINKEEEEEGDDEDEDEEDDRGKNMEDTSQGPTDVAESNPSDNNNSKILQRPYLPPSTNKRKNFRPRSIVTNESPEAETEAGSGGGSAEDVEEGDGEKAVKNRRKRSKTPLRLLKTEVMDLSLKESREEDEEEKEKEGDDEDEDSDDMSDSSRQTLNLKKYRHVKTKCHFDEKPQNLLNLLSAENNRLNNPFGIDLSKFNKNVAQNSTIDNGDGDSDKKVGKDGTFGKNGEANLGTCSAQANDAVTSTPPQITSQPGMLHARHFVIIRYYLIKYY